MLQHMGCLCESAVQALLASTGNCASCICFGCYMLLHQAVPVINDPRCTDRWSVTGSCGCMVERFACLSAQYQELTAGGVLLVVSGTCSHPGSAVF